MISAARIANWAITATFIPMMTPEPAFSAKAMARRPYGHRRGSPSRSGELLPGPAEAVDAVTGVRRQHIAGRRDALGLQLLDAVRELPPSVGGLVHLVLVPRRPVVPEHFEDPLEPVRQHQRHGLRSPGSLWFGQGRIKDGQFGMRASSSTGAELSPLVRGLGPVGGSGPERTRDGPEAAGADQELARAERADRSRPGRNGMLGLGSGRQERTAPRRWWAAVNWEISRLSASSLATCCFIIDSLKFSSASWFLAMLFNPPPISWNFAARRPIDSTCRPGRPPVTRRRTSPPAHPPGRGPGPPGGEAPRRGVGQAPGVLADPAAVGPPVRNDPMSALSPSPIESPCFGRRHRHVGTGKFNQPS